MPAQREHATYMLLFYVSEKLVVNEEHVNHVLLSKQDCFTPSLLLDFLYSDSSECDEAFLQSVSGDIDP